MSIFFNGVATMILYNYGEGPVFFTDASNLGYGLVLDKDWQAGSFVEKTSMVPLAFSDTVNHGHWYDVVKPLVSPDDVNINFCELVPVWLGLVRFAPAIVINIWSFIRTIHR